MSANKENDVSLLTTNNVDELNSNILSIFQNLDGVSDFNVNKKGSDEIQTLDFSFVFSSVKFHVNVISTILFSLIRITNKFDFTATKEFEKINLLKGANKFNACAVGVKSLIPKDDGKYVDFSAEIITKSGALKAPDLQICLMVLSGAPMNFLAVNKG